MRLHLLILIAGLLSGCTAVSDPFLETGSISTDAETLASSVPPAFAVAYIPSSAGAITSVRQTVREDYLEQYIVYENRTVIQGENVLTVRAGRPMYNKPFHQAPTSREILKEIGWYFPGVRMSIKHAIGDNLQGVYGYATGPLPSGGSCLYAWQVAKNITPKSGELFKDVRRSSYSAQIRLRFCHPSIAQERIVTLAEGLKMKPVTQQTFEMLRYAAGTALVSEQGSLTGSAGGSLEQAVAAREEAHDDDAAVPAVRQRRHVVADEQAKPLRNAAKVPLPEELSRSVSVSANNPKVLPRRENEAVSLPVRSSFVPLPGSLSVPSSD